MEGRNKERRNEMNVGMKDKRKKGRNYGMLKCILFFQKLFDLTSLLQHSWEWD